MRKPIQTDLFSKKSKSYGGSLQTTRKGRSYARPISTTQSMHLVLRSSQAIGDLSFKKPSNAKEIQRILSQFALKYGIKIISLANVGTHLHFHLKISKRQGYFRFIRAVTSAIAIQIMGHPRWSQKQSGQNSNKKFWDYRPFTRVLSSYREFLTLNDYIQINQLEGLGLSRIHAHWLVNKQHPLVC